MAFFHSDHSDDAPQENHDINVTPFIDVMLVLLIIFMVAAPLATVSIPVDLPSANAAPMQSNDEPIVLSIAADLRLLLGDQPISEAGLEEALTKLTNNDRERRIFLRADKAVPYGELMGVMNSLRDAGYLKVALVGLAGNPE